MRCTIWYHLYNLKNMKNTHGGVFLLVKLEDLACNFTKSNGRFFRFFKLFKWYQIAQSITYFPTRNRTFHTIYHAFMIAYKNIETNISEIINMALF